MSQAPAMPLYTDALLGDTLHLSTEEFGAYCLILFATWRNNGRALPDDDRALARICRVDIRKWRQSLRPRLVGFFDISGQKWSQKRLEKEWGYVENLRDINRAKGLKSANSRQPRLELGSNPQTQTHSSINNNILVKASPRARPPAREAEPAEAPWAARCNSWAKGHRWNPIDGPAPDEPGCLAPPDLAAKAVRRRNANGSDHRRKG